MLTPFMFACNKDKNTDATEKSYSELIVGEWYQSYAEYYNSLSGEDVIEEYSLEDAWQFFKYTENGVGYSRYDSVDWNNPDDTFYWSIENNLFILGYELGGITEEWTITFEGNDKFYLETTLYSPGDEDYEKNAYQRM